MWLSLTNVGKCSRLLMQALCDTLMIVNKKYSSTKGALLFLTLFYAMLACTKRYL